MARAKHRELGDRARRALLAAAQMLAFSPHQLRELPAAVVGDPPPAYRDIGEYVRRRNPAHVHAPVHDPRLEAISERFHGTPAETAILDEDQRPPREVVVIGEEVETVYRPDRHSRRGGVEWQHEAGDRGPGLPRLRGRRLLVADADGKVYTVPAGSKMKLDPDRGLVG
ncbi:MAG: hypothetical protein ACM3US_07265 [Sphingomonadaceae bacterium]